MRKCKFCGKEFSTELNHHYFAGHVANCKKNPDLEKRFEKQRQASFLQRLPLKEMALRDYCEKNSIEVIWFDANRLHRSFYRKLQQYLKNDSHLPSNIYLSL